MAYRIYLVDDDRFLLDLYAVKFKAAGHTVTCFNGGEECLTALRKKEGEAPHAILLDLIMPGVGGFELLETIREEALIPETKIIILSNQGQDADVERAKELRVDGYLIKASAIPSEVLAETIQIIEGKKPVPAPSPLPV